MLLYGSDIADYIEQRHFTAVRNMRPKPHMVIIQLAPTGPGASYIKAKKRYGADIGAIVEYIQLDPNIKTSELIRQIELQNSCQEVHGIVVQLPLPQHIDTTKSLNAIAPGKDIDGLGVGAQYDSATATGIMWLLGSYGVTLKGTPTLVIGQGQTVGKPIAVMLENAGAIVTCVDESTGDLAAQVPSAQLIISATGQPGLITPAMVSDGTVIIDAGIGLKVDKLAGDVAPELYDNPTLKITPSPGGVGPMTIAALFEQLITATRRAKD